MNRLKSWISNNRLLIILFALVTPTCLINLNGINSWGGDFSQFIHQGFNVVKGIPQSFQYYIFNPNYSGLAPQNYSPGFPLLLAPLLKVYGLNYLVLAKFMTFLSIILLCVWFIYLKKITNPILALIIIVLTGYTSFYLEFKNYILADIPFALTIAISLILIQQIENNKKYFVLNFVLLVLFSSFSVILKPLGLALILALFLYSFVVYVKKDENYKRVFFSLILSSIIGFLSYKFLIPILLGEVKEQNSHFFDLLFNSHQLADTINRNLIDYYGQISGLFAQNKLNFMFVNIVLMQFVGLSFLMGIYQSLKKGIQFNIILLLVFMGVLLLFPYNQGFRYILPLMPIFIYFIILGIESIPYPPNTKFRFLAIIVLVGFLLPLRINIVQYAKWNKNHKHIKGPLSEHGKEVFKFIKENTDEDDVIVFNKPRVLGLYCQRKSFCNNTSYNTIEAIQDDLDQFSPNYILLSSELSNYAISLYIDSTQSLKPVFSNERFTLYQF